MLLWYSLAQHIFHNIELVEFILTIQFNDVIQKNFLQIFTLEEKKLHDRKMWVCFFSSSGNENAIFCCFFQTVKVPLYQHQKQGLAWMISRENNEALPPFWVRKGNNYTNKLTNFTTLKKPEVQIVLLLIQCYFH